MDNKFGFIITRHVNCVKTNMYWNHCVKLLRTFYPFRKIIIIDDNSNYEYVKPDFDYKNVEVIQSEYPKRGELLPYYYFLKRKFFENAVIIHDSVFFEKRVPFEKYKFQVIPLWYFPNIHIHTHYDNNMKIADTLNYSNIIKYNMCVTILLI